MITTLETFGKLLSQQQSELPRCYHESEQNFTIEFDQVRIPVKVIMERMMRQVTSKEIVFTGRAYTDIAEVTFPENEKVRKAFENYFKNEVTEDRWVSMSGLKVYSHVKINGQEIPLG